jgi:hypothetical protein
MSLQGSAEAQENSSVLMHALVKLTDAEGAVSKEVADVMSVSSTGAGFYIRRNCKPGNLVSLMIPVEPQIRFHDREMELYRVWGLVQHCHKVAATGEYHIGVAFIGKNAPESFTENPQQSYRICGMDDNGMWKIQAAAKEFKPRRDSRFYAAVDHYLAVVDPAKPGPKGERTVTENISRSGAAVLTTLDLNVGDRVKFISERYDFSTVAVVCNRRQGKDGKHLLSLQFVGGAFPVDAVTGKAMESVAAPQKEELVEA